MRVSTEDLRKLLDTATTRKRFRVMPVRSEEVAALAAELITARAKIEAAEKMAEAVRRYRDFVLDHSGSNEVVPVITEPSQRVTFALAAWEAAQ